MLLIFAAVQRCKSSRREAASRHNSFALPVFLLFVSYKSHILTIARIHRGPLNVSNVDKPLEGRSSKRCPQHAPSEKKKKRLCGPSKSLSGHMVFKFLGVKRSPVATYLLFFVINPHSTSSVTSALVVSSYLWVGVCVYMCDEFGLKGCESSCLLSLMPFRADIYVAVFKKEAGRKEWKPGVNPERWDVLDFRSIQTADDNIMNISQV